MSPESLVLVLQLLGALGGVMAPAVLGIYRTLTNIKVRLAIIETRLKLEHRATDHGRFEA